MTLYSVLAAKCYWHFSVNKFKTLDKTNKINTILCRLNFYLLAYLCLSSEMWTNSEYIAWAGQKKKTVPCRPLHHRSDFIYHVKERWLFFVLLFTIHDGISSSFVRTSCLECLMPVCSNTTDPHKLLQHARASVIKQLREYTELYSSRNMSEPRARIHGSFAHHS